jgi:hypothetical protein
MFDDAVTELDSLPEWRDSMVINCADDLMQAKRWKPALAPAATQPRGTRKDDRFIHTAFCLHELDAPQEARDVSIQGLPCTPSRPFITTWRAMNARSTISTWRGCIWKEHRLDGKMRISRRRTGSCAAVE